MQRHTILEQRELAATYRRDRYQIKHISYDVLKSHERFIAAQQEKEPQGTTQPPLTPPPYHLLLYLNFALLLLMLKTGKVIHEMCSEGLFDSLFPVMWNWNSYYSVSAPPCIPIENSAAASL